jgi:hypothetical protein
LELKLGISWRGLTTCWLLSPKYTWLHVTFLPGVRAAMSAMSAMTDVCMLPKRSSSYELRLNREEAIVDG